MRWQLSEELRRTIPTVAAPMLAVAAAATAGWLAVDAGPLADIAIFRDSAQAVLNGQSPYVLGPAPFVYPPAGLLLALLTALGPNLHVAAALWVALSLAALARTLWILTQTAWPTLEVPKLLRRVCWLFAAGCLLEPTLLTLALGQVGLLLLWLTVEGTRGQPQHARRVWLVGVAAAMKLTPGVLLLGFAAAGRWRSVLWGGVGLMGATTVAAVASPAAIRDYVSGAWRLPLDANTRLNVQNHSLPNLSALLGWPSWVGLSLAAIALIAGTAVAARLWRLGDELAGLSTVLVTGLLVSPVSWGHHWVATYPALVLLLREVKTRRVWCLALLSTAFVGGSTWLDFGGSKDDELLSSGEIWTPWPLLEHDWYLLWGVAFLIWATVLAVRGQLSRITESNDVADPKETGCQGTIHPSRRTV